MWKFLKVLGALLKALFWLACLLLLTGLAALYLLERGLPEFLLRRIENAASSDDYLVRIERATYDLRHGARLYRVKALPKRVTGGALLAVGELAVEVSLLPGTPASRRLRGVVIRDIAFPALPPKSRESDPQDAELFDKLAAMTIEPFPLRVERAEILGIRAERLSATVALADRRASIRDIAIRLAHPREELDVAGEVNFDLEKRTMHGFARGRTFPENLLPLFHTIEARGAIEQIGCFSHIEEPVKADYTFDVDLPTTDFAMGLNLDVGSCLYRGVPIASVKGRLGIYGTNIYTSVTINQIEGKTAAGAPIAADLAYCEESESLRVKAVTTMDLRPLANIINVLNQGELDHLRPTAPPTLRAEGVVALCTSRSTVSNALAGVFTFPAGRILNFEVRDTTADFNLAGYSARFYNLKGKSPSGGGVTGEVSFDFPGYNATSTTFSTSIQLKEVALEEISHAFNVTNSRAGLVSGEVRIDGPAHGDTIAHLSGDGKISIRNGVINQMRLFSGFTAYLSRNVPGISSLVNQSSGSMTFTIDESVLRTNDLLLEGDIFSISGRGTYNIATDKLDFTVRANIFKRKTLAGRIAQFITLPFTRLLLEFKVFGSLENPDWSYVNIIEKISDAISSENNDE